MLLPTKQQRMLPKHNPKRGLHMNLDNRRLREIKQEIIAYSQLRDDSETMSDTLMYQGKINVLEKEEKQILKRYNVEV